MVAIEPVNYCKLFVSQFIGIMQLILLSKCSGKDRDVEEGELLSPMMEIYPITSNFYDVQPVLR